MLLRSVVVRLTFIFLFACAWRIVKSQAPQQNKPYANLAKAPASLLTPETVPQEYQGIPLNYVRSREALLPIIDENIFNYAEYEKVKQTTIYYDGLGRLLQTVSRQASAGSEPRDIIQPVIYDQLGREALKYLPYAQKPGLQGSDGSFKGDLFSGQLDFYRNYRDADHSLSFEGEQFFYSKTDYEGSPLGRVTRTMAAGNSWVGSNRGVGYQYLFNSVADSVRCWKMTTGQAAVQIFEEMDLPVTESCYEAGTLFKNVTTDENGHSVVEYTDKEGQVVLKKVQVGEVSAGYGGHSNWLCTYYVYDDLERLVFVIPPKAVEAITGSWSVSAAVAAELCFAYGYDGRGRMIRKKVPGAGWVEMVYDRRDRLVFTRDGVLREKGCWQARLYDALNREVSTGIVASGYGAAELQRYVDGVEAAVAAVAIGEGYTLEVMMNPLPPGSAYEGLTITRYDDYSWTHRRYTDKYNGKLEGGKKVGVEEMPWAAEQQNVVARGMVTGKARRVLEEGKAGKWLERVIFYDSKGRVVQTWSENYRGGEDVVTNRYDFSGRVVSEYAEHSNPQSKVGTVRVKTVMEYDHGGRLVETWKMINDDESTRRLVARNSYNPLGQLQRKELGVGGREGRPVETLDYSYNIRGWITGINGRYSRPDGPKPPGEERWFGMQLNYDQGSTAGGSHQYTGNISSVLWKSRGDGQGRAYGFSYDMPGRLLGADYSEYNGGVYADNGQVNFDMVMGDGVSGSSAYDGNGNILSMKQWGLQGNSSAVIDDLKYSYHDNSNKLRAVADLSPAIETRGGDFHDGSKGQDDYGYDVNGNMVTDLNKGLGVRTRIADGTSNEGGEQGIEYNHLDLPCKITVRDRDGNLKGRISYVYDAEGNKLQKRVVEYAGAGNGNRQKETVTTYLEGFVYEQVDGGVDELRFLLHEEGRVRLDTQGNQALWQYDYFTRDHLGNVRMVLTEQEEVASYPVASLETATLEEEKKYYRLPGAEGARVRRSDVPGYPDNDGYTNPNEYVQKLNGSGTKVGTAIVLKVMSGDRVNIRASSWYRRGGVVGPEGTRPVTEIIGAFAGGLAGSARGKGAGAPSVDQPGILAGAVAEFLAHEESTATGGGKPKAYLNWLVLDEQLKAVISSDGQNSGFEQVGEDQEFKVHTITGREITKNGYLYIYLSNATPDIDVFFDNLQVTHIKGPLLEETHYYPFGLTMAGISSRAMMAGNFPQNHKEYNGIEHTTDLDLNQYDAFYRTLDPQTGRWWQIDPKVDQGYESISPYAAMNNNPARDSDLLGDEADVGCPTCPILGQNVLQGTKEVGEGIKEGVRTFLVSAGGLLNGVLNTLTFGAWPTNPSEVINGSNTLTTDDQQLYESSVNVGQNAAVAASVLEGVPVKGLSLATVTGPKISLPKLPVFPLNNQFRSNSRNESAAGTTSSGHPTDRHGNKLGPSGKPQINVVRHSTQKRAKDAARATGNGKPIKHTNPKKGKNHYHAVDKYGNKKRNSTHHEYHK